MGGGAVARGAQQRRWAPGLAPSGHPVGGWGAAVCGSKSRGRGTQPPAGGAALHQAVVPTGMPCQWQRGTAPKQPWVTREWPDPAALLPLWCGQPGHHRLGGGSDGPGCRIWPCLEQEGRFHPIGWEVPMEVTPATASLWGRMLGVGGKAGRRGGAGRGVGAGAGLGCGEATAGKVKNPGPPRVWLGTGYPLPPALHPSRAAIP